MLQVMTETAKHSKDWIEDCEHWWGKVLTGRKAHWCLSWDHLPIDDTCWEIAYCLCFEETHK